MRFILFLAVFLGATTAHAGELVASWAYAEKHMAKAGFDRAFIKALKKTYEPKDFKSVLELNLLLFMRKSDYHGVQVTPDAVSAVSAFMAQNRGSLERAEKDYGLSGPVIASLLWIESRYGSNLGTFHVPSVYVHLLQTDRADVLAHLKKDGARRFTQSPSKADLKKIPGRAKTKAVWAMGELKALEKIYKRRGDFTFGLRGSFSGAFGMSQFLPSSYSRWAKSTRPGAAPDLRRSDDAIRSVAFYLKENGWRKSRPKSHMRALLNYNNSRDYANAILTLAKQVEGRAVAASAGN